MSRKNTSHDHIPDPFDGRQQSDDLRMIEDEEKREHVEDKHNTTHTASSTAFEDDGRHEAGKRDVECIFGRIIRCCAVRVRLV